MRQWWVPIALAAMSAAAAVLLWAAGKVGSPGHGKEEGEDGYE